MEGSEVLKKIVVRIADGEKRLLGTGFFISDEEILTCYHVLAYALADSCDQLPDSYLVKNEDWEDWKEAAPVESKCSAIKDFAVLSCNASKKPGHGRISFARWDGKSKEFLTRGYDRNTTDADGSFIVSDDGCRILGRTSLKKEPRLQLSTIKETLLKGRSGSPIWSLGQKAIVGMLDNSTGEENDQKDRSTAIPVEELPIDSCRLKGEPINVPSLPADFIARPDDLDGLKELVLFSDERRSAITGKTTGDCSVSRVGLHGMGGIGKSVLAAALARDDQILEAFFDGVIWIALGQTPNLPNRQLQLLRFLDKDHRAITDEQDGLGCLRLALRDKTCLIILDDVWSMNDVRAFDAMGPDCRLLITTRDREIVRGLKAEELCLDVLGVEQSLELLAMSSGQDIAALGSKARQVAEECDRLPLALAMVGSMAKAAIDRGKSDPWEHILYRLQSADIDRIRADFPNYPYPNLLRAIEVSVESLKPDEQKRYLDLAVFPEDASVPEAALQTLWELDECDTDELAGLFSDRSLCRFNSGWLGLHDLQHDFAVKRTEDLQGLHRKLLDAYARKCSGGWYTGPEDGYFLGNLAYHLLKSGREKDLKELLLDYRWLKARLQEMDITSLISDYDLLTKDEEVGLCRDCLRLSAHVLRKDSSQLSGQLLGRMQHLSHPGIQGLMKQAAEGEGCPWLRPITASLTLPHGSLIRTLSSDAGWVRTVSITSDGTRAVSASDDNNLKVWDLESGQEIWTLEGHSDWIKAVALTSDGKRAISASNDSILMVWDLEKGQEINKLAIDGKNAISIAITSDGTRAILAMDDNSLEIWDLAHSRKERTLAGHSDAVNAITLMPDGTHMISASNDCTIKIWDLEYGREIQTLNGHSSGVKAVAATSDGRHLISASADNTIKVWDLEKGQEIKTLANHNNTFLAVALSLNGKYAILALNNNTLNVWDLENDEEKTPVAGHAGWVKAIALAPDGKRAISASSDNTIKTWDLEIDRDIKRYIGHAGWVNAIVLTSNGQEAISASSDNTLKIWNLKNGQEMQTLAGHLGWVRAIAISPDRSCAISASNDNTLNVWDLERGKRIKTLTGHTDWVNAVAFLPDGRRAISASDDTTLKIWDLRIGQEIRTLVGHFDWVRAVAITPDGQRAASASSDNTIRIWDLESGKAIFDLAGHTGWIRAIAITFDGRKLISASSDNTLKIWDLQTGQKIRTLAGHSSFVNAIALTPDGQFAVSASDDKMIKIWDLHNGMEIKALIGHEGFINAIAVASNGQYAISVSDDNTIKVWDLKTYSLVSSFTGDSFMLSCAIDPGNLTIVAGEASGKVHFLRLEGFPPARGP